MYWKPYYFNHLKTHNSAPLSTFIHPCLITKEQLKNQPLTHTLPSLSQKAEALPTSSCLPLHQPLVARILHTHVCIRVLKSEDQLRESVLPYHVDSRDQTQVTGLGGVYPHLLSSHTSPTSFMSLLCFTLAFIPNLRNKTCKNCHCWAVTTRTIKAKIQLIFLYLQYVFVSHEYCCTCLE